MKQLIKQEVFKQYKQKNFIFHGLLIIISTTAVAMFIKYSQSTIFSLTDLLPTLFGAAGLIVFCLVYQASQIISMEFRYGSIKILLTQGYHHHQVMASKLVILFAYTLYLYGLAFGMTLLLKGILFSDIPVGDILEGLMLNTLGSMIASWLFVSIVLLVACLVKNDAIASLAGVIVYFLGSMFAGIQFSIIQSYSWLRWNPLNMLNLNNQLTNYEGMHSLTKLSNGLLIFGNSIYVILFLGIAYVAFKKRKI